MPRPGMFPGRLAGDTPRFRKLGAMPLPRTLARFNKHATNKVLGRLDRWPPFAAIGHTGRSSGREYRTPLNAFPCGDAFLVPLNYGSGSDWVRNVLHHGTATLWYRGEEIEVFRPRVVDRGEAWDCLPLYLQPPLRVIGTSEFLMVRRR